MNKWKVTYDINDEKEYYVHAMTFNEAVSKIALQDWKQDSAFIIKVELVE